MIKILKYGKDMNSSIFARTEMPSNVQEIVASIIRDIREGGDASIRKYNEKFDGYGEEDFQVSPDEIWEAMESVDPEFLKVMEEAAENIRDFHKNQVREGFSIRKEGGIVLGQKVLPVEKVGIYVPGGTAAYPSTVLMNVIPASLAGCKEIVITTPATGGKVNPNILAAAHIAGATKIFKVGGAQAIAALAYGTETVPRVYKITGPGNAFVAEAKKQVFGQVAIDMIAGPSEILIISDGEMRPDFLAADMLSQAEHDKFASAVLITDSEKLAEEVALEIEKQLPDLPREEIARASIENNGKIIVTDSLEKAVEVSNEIAPEHLELCVAEPFEWLEKITNAGSVFLGRDCPEALGDYFAGPNHTLPTSGTAKFASPLGVDDFVKRMQFSYYTPEELDKAAYKIRTFAEKEGLQAHGRSAVIRSENR
ncbi:histidinol dehydrogenase [Baileyella intestinalis]|uniref:histidinol dehydrogenase n=1 Tax=Baileyella intestinalis TaxID=2606709 RepID=UPI0022E3C0A5|nr:histidinol dehydrogenase [Baileyella intestinalis]